MVDFVTAWVRRYQTLANLECNMTEIERLLAELADDVRRDADEKRRDCDDVVYRLEALARDAEVAAENALEARDQCERFHYAGVLRRGVDLLRGSENDLTPPRLDR